MKNRKLLTAIMAASLVVATCIPAFAGTAITVTNSIGEVVTTGEYGQDELTDGALTEECQVTCDVAAFFEVTIPKVITLDYQGNVAYTVNVVGDVAGDQTVTVTPDATFVLSEDGGGKADITATVTQADCTWAYAEIMANDGTTKNGSIAAPVTAGQWTGAFDFAIAFQAVAPVVEP